MRIILAALLAVALAGCAGMAGSRGQYQSTETIEIAKKPTRFYEDVIAVGEQLGYQHTGGNRSTNSVMLADQPNFGETLLGKSYTTQITVTLQPNGRTIDVMYTAFGGRSTAGAKKSQERIETLKAALSQRFGGAR